MTKIPLLLPAKVYLSVESVVHSKLKAQVTKFIFPLVHVAVPVNVGIMHDKVSTESTSKDPIPFMLILPVKNELTKITNSKENSHRKVPYKMAKRHTLQSIYEFRTAIHYCCLYLSMMLKICKPQK